MSYPGRGDAWPCATCGKLVLGDGAWGISPDAVCFCAVKRPLHPTPNTIMRVSPQALQALTASLPIYVPPTDGDSPYTFWLGRDAP